MQVATLGDQTCNEFKKCQLLVKSTTNTSSAIWWPHWQPIQVAPPCCQNRSLCKWCHLTRPLEQIGLLFIEMKYKSDVKKYWKSKLKKSMRQCANFFWTNSRDAIWWPKLERSLLNFFPILATRWRPGNLYIISSHYQVGLDLFHEFGSKYPKYQEVQRSTKEN